MRNRLRWATTLSTALLALSLVLSSCGGQPAAKTGGNTGTSTTTTSQQPQGGQTITTAFTSNIETLDPAKWTDMTSMYAMEMVYDTLVTYDPSQTTTPKIVPDVATWDVTPDGLKYTFHIKPGIKFSNGDPLDAYAVKYSLDRVTSKDPIGAGAAPYGFAYSAIQGYKEWNASGQKASPDGKGGLPGVKVIDPQTVEIDLSTPQAFFLNTLALMSAAIVDPKVAEQYGKDFSAHAVGSGPFMLQSWQPGVQMTLVPNPNYWNQANKPKIAKLVLKENVSDNLQLLQFRQGDLDFIGGPLTTAQYAQVLSDPKLKSDYYKVGGNIIYYLAFNTTKPPFNNPLVRQAVNYAIDKQQIIQNITNGRGQVASQPLPPGIPGYDPSIQPYPYDPAKAKQLLQQAGVQLPLKVTMIYPSNTQDHIRTAQMVQQQLQQVGIDVTLQGFSQVGSYWPYEDDPTKPWNIAWTDWFQDYPDAQDFLYNLLSKDAFNSTNVGNWTDPTFEQLVTKADSLPASQQDQRVQLYQQAEKIAHDQAAWVFLYYGWYDALIQPWLKPDPHDPASLGVYLHPVSTPRFNLMSVQK
ncbi:MAG: ABC transporter substrate-binding protein [Clostridia bacterium]|nr:ABC transporter substrate-binding protein [Clostridia bacterium]